MRLKTATSNVKHACTAVGGKNTLLIDQFLIVQIQKIKIMLYVLSYPPQRDIFEAEWIIREDRKDKIGRGKIRIRLSYPPQRDVIESGWIILEDRMIGLFSLCSSRDGVDGAQNHITQVHQSTQVHKNTTCAPSPTGYTRLPDLNLSWFHDPTFYFPSLFLILEIPMHIWQVPDIFAKEFKSIKENALLKGIILFHGEEVGRPLVICQHTDARPSDAWSTWCGVRTLKLLMITSRFLAF